MCYITRRALGASALQFHRELRSQGQGSNVRVPHLACKVWVRSLYSLKRWECVKYRINTDLFLSVTTKVKAMRSWHKNPVVTDKTKTEKTFWLKSSSNTNGSTQRDDAPLPRKMGLFPVYRLEEAEGLLKEGGVWGSAGALRARSYKTHPKPKHQGEAPRLFKGFFLFLSFISNTSLEKRAVHWFAFWNDLSSYF